MRGLMSPNSATFSGVKPSSLLKLSGKYVNVARPVRTALMIADKKNERLIAVIAFLSVERKRVRKIPITAVTIPIAGTING